MEEKDPGAARTYEENLTIIRSSGCPHIKSALEDAEKAGLGLDERAAQEAADFVLSSPEDTQAAQKK
jgi:hypothetical protein